MRCDQTSSRGELMKEITHSNRAVVYEMRNNIIRAIQLFLSTQRQWRRMRRKASQYMNIAETNGYAGAIAIRSPLLLQISPAWVSWCIHNCMFPSKSYRHASSSIGCVLSPCREYILSFLRRRLDCDWKSNKESMSVIDMTRVTDWYRFLRQ